MRTARDWGQACPNPDCSHYTRMHQGNISAVATYMTESGKRRIFRCSACQRQFSETRDTAFFDLRTPEEKVITHYVGTRLSRCSWFALTCRASALCWT